MFVCKYFWHSLKKFPYTALCESEKKNTQIKMEWKYCKHSTVLEKHEKISILVTAEKL